jgi:ribosomal protein S27AE
MTTNVEGVPIDECWLEQRGIPTWEQYLPAHIEDDVSNKVASKISRCHVCQCDSLRGWCRNPSHSFLGTHTENNRMITAAGNHNWSDGRGVYRNPENPDECLRLTAEEAEIRGWVAANSGRGLYRNPDKPEECRWLTKEEAEKMGWVHASVGLEREKLSCPHCGNAISANMFSRWHGDKCVKREGSERWLRERKAARIGN